MGLGSFCPLPRNTRNTSRNYTTSRVWRLPILPSIGLEGGYLSKVGAFLSVDISWGIALPIPVWRPLWFIATVEAFFARMLFGTKTHGRTKNNRREWYSIRSISRVLNAEARFDGHELGGSESFTTNACFGFSEPPSMPASVSLKSYIE